jgi:hypothetical protein
VIRAFLASASRRARLVAAREAFLDAFFWLSFAAASLLVADRIRLELAGEGSVFSDARGAAASFGVAGGLSAAVALARFLLFRPAPRDLARAADRRLGLADRLATALDGPGGPFSPLVEREASSAVAGVPARRAFPAPPLGARKWSAGAALCAVLVALLPVPEPRSRVALRVRERRPFAGATIEPGDASPSASSAVAGGAGAGASSAGGGGKRDPYGHPFPAPPLFGDPERHKFRERPEHVKPLVGDGDWKAVAGVDPGAAAGGAPDAASESARVAEYRRQAEAWAGRDSCPASDREIVRTYFDRIAPK